MERGSAGGAAAARVGSGPADGPHVARSLRCAPGSEPCDVPRVVRSLRWAPARSVWTSQLLLLALLPARPPPVGTRPSRRPSRTAAPPIRTLRASLPPIRTLRASLVTWHCQPCTSRYPSVPPPVVPGRSLYGRWRASLEPYHLALAALHLQRPLDGVRPGAQRSERATVGDVRRLRANPGGRGTARGAPFHRQSGNENLFLKTGERAQAR